MYGVVAEHARSKEERAANADGVDPDSDMTRYDERRLRALIESHARYTNSIRATNILNNWDNYLPKFIKVMPVDYRRALREMQEQAVMQAQTAAE